ncbi:MAG: hypothetical protein COV65_03310 [Nitrosopumilales archaeon CG11_big_fil_rev_8_21_14_0_20_33_24]|jgi:hypothetical protein|nr:MAG: hypothetical protein COV65_03310 [Nitrosopumilales archaeon CG11_big_fil_rev_8_21_14_0_20_33_24]PIY88643.1 MAG: hypothetical protein COY74_07930 [Nitrosopumilales archaeon CG_4_10_14_0_8_um_filter_34_8]PJB97697.1 MAG: hypothetical protein CO079_06175 [Nitrosopumilales archaeon CG_4_9_14_0_8_um_filter_34_10]
MDKSIDVIKTLEIIEKMKFAKIGEYKKWNTIVKKIKNKDKLSTMDLKYFSNMTRIYKNSNKSSRSKAYHTKLSKHDEKPACKICGKNSEYYCNMNDQYFCMIHVVGHDENEF